MARGIYSTALLRLIFKSGHEISSPTPSQKERFETWTMESPDVVLSDTQDKHAIKILGKMEYVEEFVDVLKMGVPSTIFVGDVMKTKSSHDLVQLVAAFPLDAKLELDVLRSEVTYTVPWHHFCRAGSEGLSLMVSFAEQMLEEGLLQPEKVYPVFREHVSRLTPRLGSLIRIVHSKLNGRNIVIGPARVVWRKEGVVKVQRRIIGGGVYDGLNIPKSPGDYAITELRKGCMYTATKYYSLNGNLKGEYYSVCTPIEMYDTYVKYVDLGVDVVKPFGKEPSMIDQEEPREACAAGRLPEQTMKKAFEVAEGLMKMLS
ncbi:MAG: hypothetical protein B9J98_07920 [Candidatus Terraquivivens tikiterensis]|uniref:DUF402 domain-containing protein n=1 Tax=Candidatus Terraquivivens tikiterensis TaxID=1980982 RepID=A0A2R7Y0L9_9ARCH|nr:MAG: hypothetical protein B9J98_07920 [Candidatus Terraquivivens tikiterensis]